MKRDPWWHRPAVAVLKRVNADLDRLARSLRERASDAG